MKKIKYLFILFMSICFTYTAGAQQGTVKLGLNYNYSFPLSGFKNDIIKHSSPRGFTGDVMYSFNNKFSGGLAFGFQDYYQKYPRVIYHSGGQDVSAVLSNSVQTTPLLLKGNYFFMPTSFLHPYVSLGAGVNIINFKQYLGEFGSNDTHAGFLAEGGVGLMIPFRKTGTTGFNIGASYNYSPYNKDGYKNLNSANIHAGLVFELH